MFSNVFSECCACMQEQGSEWPASRGVEGIRNRSAGDTTSFVTHSTHIMCWLNGQCNVATCSDHSGTEGKNTETRNGRHKQVCSMTETNCEQLPGTAVMVPPCSPVAHRACRTNGLTRRTPDERKPAAHGTKFGQALQHAFRRRLKLQRD